MLLWGVKKSILTTYGTNLIVFNLTNVFTSNNKTMTSAEKVCLM